MVQVVILNANGESRTLKSAVLTGTITGELVAKAIRRAKAAEKIGVYTWEGQMLTVWGWREGKAGTENKHELPPPHDEVLLFGDAVITADGDFTVDNWTTFYEQAFGGFESIKDEESEVEEDEKEDDEVEEKEEEEEEEEIEEEEEAEEVEEEEAEDEDADCYDDEGDGGGGKRRAPRRRMHMPASLRKMDMGVMSKIKIPSPPGRKAPRWQTAPELQPETYA
jgi:hypothetical protein